MLLNDLYASSLILLLDQIFCCCCSVTKLCRLFATPQTAARQDSLSFTNSWSLFKLMSIEWVIPSSHFILCYLLFSSCLQSFPASGSFPVSRLFAPRDQSTGASSSASVLPMNIQGWFSLGLTGLIFLQSKGLSRDFPNTTVQKHQFFSAQPSLCSSSHIRTWPAFFMVQLWHMCMTTGKTIALTIWTIVGNVSAF